MAVADGRFHASHDGLHGLIDLKALGQAAAEDADTVVSGLAAHQVGAECGQERFTGTATAERQTDGRALKIHGFEEIPGGMVAGTDGIFGDVYTAIVFDPVPEADVVCRLIEVHSMMVGRSGWIWFAGMHGDLDFRFERD